MMLTMSLLVTLALSKPPNFLILFLDDFGWGDFSGNDPT
jgi:hypothetical protein